MDERIGTYRLERRLGQGGMGEVFLAWDDRLERRVAIKRIRQEGELTPEQRERLRREARAAARLSHSAVVQVYDLVLDEAGDALVMEYLEGQTLAERLAAGPLSAGEALRLGREIAEGLAAAHAAGLIHRDLKAANVILTPSGHAKILDFGLARPAVRPADEEALTRQGAVIGTFHAMSPEQAGGGEVDERSDLFSLGALLYEMLTGRAPFRGDNPLDTLRRVLTEQPPALPGEIGTLISRLLAKDRRERPRSADEVARELARIAGDHSVSDLPTGSVLALSRPVPPAAEGSLPVSTIAGPALKRRRVTMAAAGVLLAAALAGSVYLQRRPAAPLRVAVAMPETKGTGDELSLVASGALAAILGSLSSFQGLAAIDPREAGRGGTSPVQIARTAAADEVLISTVEREGALSRVSLRRVQGSDGRVLWSETFQVPADPQSLRLLADAVAVHLRRAYPNYPLRPGTPELEVRDEDYAAFLHVRQRIDAGETQLEPELARLEEAVRLSPRFLEAQLQAARVALTLFQARQESSYLDRAARLARQARELAPNDARPLLLELQITLNGGREEEAAALLSRLEEILPGDSEVLVQRSRLTERQGRTGEALEALRTAAERTPSWQNLYRLAQLEAKTGHIVEARGRIGAILRQSPDNAWAKEALGHLELVYGDLERAEQIYLECSRSAPRRALNNLGMARFFRGRYREAADAYRRSLALQPDHVITQLNLADAELELGRAREAETLYRSALERLAATQATAGLSLRERMLQAQCLARLGRTREAAEIAQEALRRGSDNPEMLYQGALVYSLTGDRNPAFQAAKAALAGGIQPRSFAGSAFRSLREDPDLRPFFQTGAPAGPRS